jgi:putative FmdB family regulatory protein
MPTYEYRCPRGHTFELFQRMSDPPAAECQICGATPVEKVLYPAAIHFKGSGFYSTDYGKKKGVGASGSSDSTKSEDSSSKESKPSSDAKKDAKKSD